MIKPALGFGVQIACEGMSWSECRDIARTAERCGYSSLWVPDHYVATPDGISGDIRTPLLDGWTTLGALAHETSRLRLGPLVASNTFRPPVILAKMIASLDHISGGRMELDADVYRSCDPSGTLKTIATRARRPLGEVASSLKRGIQENLILELDGRYLALAVPGDIPSYCTISDFPGGGEKLLALRDRITRWAEAGHVREAS